MFFMCGCSAFAGESISLLKKQKVKFFTDHTKFNTNWSISCWIALYQGCHCQNTGILNHTREFFQCHYVYKGNYRRNSMLTAATPHHDLTTPGSSTILIDWLNITPHATATRSSHACTHTHTHVALLRLMMMLYASNWSHRGNTQKITEDTILTGGSRPQQHPTPGSLYVLSV